MRDNAKMPTVNEVVGLNIRRLRVGRGDTQDQTATLLRRFGLNVSRSALMAIERGTGRSLDLGEVALVCLALDVPVSELLIADGPISVSGESALTGAAIQSAFATNVDASTSLNPSDISIPITREIVKADLPKILADLKRRYERLWSGASPAQIVQAERAAHGDTERKAASRLQVRPESLSVAAFGRWGRSLNDERELRAGPRLSPDLPERSARMVRAHITSQLCEELTPLFRKGD